MSTKLSPLDAWLTSSPALTNGDAGFWDPGFNAERRIVVAKLGPYQRLFERPQHFVPKFFHTVYPVPIEEWQLTSVSTFFGGFCTVTAELQLHFQATLSYVQANLDTLPNINQQIKTSYQSILKDIMLAELNQLKDGVWIQSGLAEMERQIADLINETLMLKHIQCRALCTLTPSFEEITEQVKLDGRFTQEAMYLSLMQKNFEFRERQKQELLRQEAALELLALKHQQNMLETLNQEDELHKQKQALAAEAVQRRLEEQETQRQAQHLIEMRLQQEKAVHDAQLKEIELAAELAFQKQKHLQEQALALEQHAQQLEHEQQLKAMQREAETNDYAQQRKQWLEGKEQEQRLKQLELDVELTAQASHQAARQQLAEKLAADHIAHQNRLHQMQLDAEIKELEVRHEASKNKDEYLRREIEWLVLDKQRAELTRAIKAASDAEDGQAGGL